MRSVDQSMTIAKETCLFLSIVVSSRELFLEGKKYCHILMGTKQ